MTTNTKVMYVFKSPTTGLYAYVQDDGYAMWAEWVKKFSDASVYSSKHGADTGSGRWRRVIGDAEPCEITVTTTYSAYLSNE